MRRPKIIVLGEGAQRAYARDEAHKAAHPPRAADPMGRQVIRQLERAEVKRQRKLTTIKATGKHRRNPNAV